MAKKPLPSPELLRQLLRYEPDTGKLFWRERTPLSEPNDKKRKIFNTQFVGKEALTTKLQQGCLMGSVKKTKVYAHRVIWAIVYGEWPKEVIDHIDGDPSNNRLNNLRHVPQVINTMNSKKRSDNVSGHAGVNWHVEVSKWRAYITIDGRYKHLGLFDDISDAIAARKAAQIGTEYTQRHGT